MKEDNYEEYDVLVVGGGIAGMEAALTLGNAGLKVLLVEKSPSIGGYMALLSKVFPTLDCASCITTPKMAETNYHPNITLLTYSEVQEVVKDGEADFKVKILKKPRYVDETACTGCGDCERACPVIIPDEYQLGLRGRKAAYIAFDIAVPKKAVIDLDNCILCGACERVCPAYAIDFTQQPKIINVKVGAIIIAVGFKLFPAELKTEWGYGRYKNVITSMQMDRILAPTSPYGGVVRPSDGKEPMKIAYVLCVGSRDLKVNNPNCSQVCCMYSIKQAQLLLGALPLADVTIFYIDIRAFGKGYEEFYKQAKEMGVMFVKGRAISIEELEDGSVKVRYEDMEDEGKIKEDEFDLVVLSVGLLPNYEIVKAFKNVKIELDPYGWINQPETTYNPAKTNVPGVFVAGTVTGPKDIPDSIVSAAAAASQVIAYLNKYKPKVEVQSK
ncbi:MAG: FAD-dependent oxidoreductase [Candidatus Njordarchaeia archaeon]